MRQVCHIAVQVASEVEDAGNKEADTRTSAVPQEVPDTMTNAAPGSCTGIVQSNSGAPMRVPGSGLHATSGNVSGCSTAWALKYWLCVCSCVCVCVCVCVYVSVCACVCVCVCLYFLGAQHCHMPPLNVLT